MRIFLAGATGVIGIRLVPLLTAAGQLVAGMTRSPEKTERLRSLGADPVVCDVFDLERLTRAVSQFRPDVVMHQLTDLPDALAELRSYRARNERMRSEGTRNLLSAARTAGAARVVAQSIAWELPDERARATVSAHEHTVLDEGGVVIRYGQLYGPETFYESQPPPPPRIHVEEAARQTVPALDAAPGSVITAVESEVGAGAE